MKCITIFSAYSKPFIKRDIDLLTKEYHVESFLQVGKKISDLLKLIKIIRKCEVCIFWFADFIAFFGVIFCRLYKKKSIVILGGYELAAIPELNYGGLLSPFSRCKVKFILQQVNIAVPVDESLQQEAEKNLNLKDVNFHVVPTGYNDDFFYPEGIKNNNILSVATASTIEIAKLKGLDYFVKVSSSFPDYNFQIVGIQDKAKEWLSTFCSQNVQFYPQQTQENLRSFYQQAKIYCQLSIREGLPNSLCEAMLCGCIPVGSNVNGIPKAIGKTGVIWKDRSLDTLQDCITEALSLQTQEQARNRIQTFFSFDQRKKSLNLIIEKICRSN